MRSRFLSLFILVFMLAVVGCGDSKTEIPKDLNKPLPPPPVGTGGKAKVDAPSNSQQ